MIEKENFNTLLEAVMQKNGLSELIDDQKAEVFYQLTERMMETNRVMNITALDTMEKIIPLHYADCLMAAHCIPEGVAVLDVGCGGGFPILPLAIARPDLHIVGLDSTEKKVKYVKSTGDALGLSIQTVSARAEDLARTPMWREQFDVVISRAVARMNILNELCLPFVKLSGQFIAMKGAQGNFEADEAKAGCVRLGGEIQLIREYDLFLSNVNCEKRTLISVIKQDHTPLEFPRSFGSIKKKPL